MESSSLPIKYLGLSLSVNYARTQECNSLIEYVQRRIVGWEAQTLSFGGRIELVRMVVSAVSLLWLQSIMLLSATIPKVEKICADFT